MTNENSLIDKIMNGIRHEVEDFVKQHNPNNDILSDVEERSKQLAKACGGVAFEATINNCLKAQNYGHIGNQVETTDGGVAYFERYEKRWVLTHLGRFRINRAYYWDAKNKTGAIPLDVSWDLDQREPSPS